MGNIISSYYLGEMHLNGYGVPKDNKKAFELFLDSYNLKEKKDCARSLGIMVFDS